MIVVGVDGSHTAKDAIRWAVDEARLRNTGVRAIYCWTMPTLTGFQYIPPELLDPEELERRAQQIVDTAVSEATGDADGVTVEGEAIQGSPAETLLAQSRDADLLVLGSRGHGGFSGLLLGSVGQQCVHHAVCPVVIVRPADRTTEGSST